ncbi:MULTISPECIES: P1 family peptidase [unclassified Microbacterium]|uniref:DmpA family aminopeptidase n=1 Tax=unclassified Microbacterium TaxID=2609290 RepID=UPI0036661725
MSRARARDLGLIRGGIPGPHNAITDVPGVEVGYSTLIEDRASAVVRTGVTAILPRGRAGAADPVAAGVHSLNGNGEMTGSVWIAESGSLGTPVLITNTHSVGAAHEGAIRWMLDAVPGAADQWLLPVVAETWDGRLNDINGLHVRPEHAVGALEAARSGPVDEGAVGGGTGMICYGFKGGSGTASRRVVLGDAEYAVGVFLQANFGEMSELTVRGEQVGPALKAELSAGSATPAEAPVVAGAAAPPQGAGSVIVVVATDAPLLPGQCTAMARRVSLGLARTGTAGSHFSGDIFLAFSTANAGALASRFPAEGEEVVLDDLRAVPWGRMDPLYTAVVEATEEAVLNVLVAGEDMVGHRQNVHGLPIERVQELLQVGQPGAGADPHRA